MPDATSPLVLYGASAAPLCRRELKDVVVLPGSFNPLHRGHLKLRYVAEQLLKQEVVFELSVSNAEKRSLTEEQIASRLEQFQDARVALTNSALFSQKSQLFPGCWFVVGYDTAARLVDPKFYGGFVHQCDQALSHLQAAAHRFLVAGRFCAATERFLGVEQVSVPHQFRDMFVGISEEQFRDDISSTQLRNTTQGRAEQGN